MAQPALESLTAVRRSVRLVAGGSTRVGREWRVHVGNCVTIAH